MLSLDHPILQVAEGSGIVVYLQLPILSYDVSYVNGLCYLCSETKNNKFHYLNKAHCELDKLLMNKRLPLHVIDVPDYGANNGFGSRDL